MHTFSHFVLVSAFVALPFAAVAAGDPYLEIRDVDYDEATGDLTVELCNTGDGVYTESAYGSISIKTTLGVKTEYYGFSEIDAIDPDECTDLWRQNPFTSFSGQGGVLAGTYDLSMTIQNAQADHATFETSVYIATTLPVAAGLQFSDFDQTYKHADAIYYLRAHRIVEGYADNSFRPDATINRAEFAKIITIVSSGGLPTQGAGKCFTDITGNEWFAATVCWAKGYGAIGGYPDGTFRPARSISFAEAAKIIVLIMDPNGMSPVPPNEPWYRPYVQYLEERGAIPVSITSFEQNITRGEMAEMIYRLRVAGPWKGQTYDWLARPNKETFFYRNRSYSVEAPADWISSGDDFIDGHGGTSFRPPYGHPQWDYLLLSIEPSCPDIEHLRPTPTPDPVDVMVFNGSEFHANPWSEGAAGSSWRGKVYVYAYPLDGGRCFVARTSIYSNPASYETDGDMESDLVRISVLEEAFEKILNTIVFYLG